MATRKDVRVRVRLNVLSYLLNDKGEAHTRPPRQGSQRKTIIDIPEVEISSDELEIRLEKAQDVLRLGFWVDPDEVPPQVTTDDPSSLTSTGVVLNGHIKPGGVLIETTCGFQYGTTKALGSTAAADQSTMFAAVNTAITATLAGLTPSTRYYYRAYATDLYFSGGKFGTIKSFITPAV